MSSNRVRHYFTKNFCEDYKSAGLDRRIVAKQAKRLSSDPSLGRKFDSMNPECYEWVCIMDRVSYHWHYIKPDGQNMIQSVALTKHDIGKINKGPIDRIMFGMRLLGAMTREFVKGLLVG